MKLRILIIGLTAAQNHALSTELMAIAQSDNISISTAPSATPLHITRHYPDLLIAPLNSENLSLARRMAERAPRLHVFLLHHPATPVCEIAALRQLGWGVASNDLGYTRLAYKAGALLGLCPEEPDGGEGGDMRPAATMGDVQILLDVLRRQTKAQLVLYTDQIGNVITHRGDSDEIDMTSISSLISGSFANSIELGRMLKDPDTRHLTVLEGKYFDIYATNVGKNRLITLIFPRAFVEPKLGFVWLQLRRAAIQLSQMRIVEGNLGEMMAAELSSSLDSEFDRLFSDNLHDASVDT